MRPAELNVSVREFVEFAYRTGNLGGEGKFLARDRAVEGTKGHRKILRARGEEYLAEAPLEYTVERDGVTLKLAGRIDGVMTQTLPQWSKKSKRSKPNGMVRQTRYILPSYVFMRLSSRNRTSGYPEIRPPSCVGMKRLCLVDYTRRGTASHPPVIGFGACMLSPRRTFISERSVFALVPTVVFQF